LFQIKNSDRLAIAPAGVSLSSVYCRTAPHLVLRRASRAPSDLQDGHKAQAQAFGVDADLYD
jgi:hypothetical protein